MKGSGLGKQKSKQKSQQEIGQDAEGNPLWQRLAWLVVIWCASVATLALVAYLLRLFMNAAGMETP
jgi:hypothetical protein